MLAQRMIADGDKNSDQKLSAEEFAALSEAWFDKLDPEKTASLSQEKFTEKFGSLLPAPPSAEAGDDENQGRRRGGGGFNPTSFLAPGLFSATDTGKDGSLTREEWKSTFSKWFVDWDKEKSGALGEESLREGLSAVLPRPQFGGRGGPGSGRGGPGGGSSWSVPLLIKTGEREELIVSFPNRLAAYEPKTGQQLWVSKGLGGTIYTTPLWGEGTLVAASSGMGGASAIAIKPGGAGDVTDSHRLWRLESFKSAIGSGVIHEGHFYTIDQQGNAACYSLKTGAAVWEERLRGSGRGGSWSSILLAESKLYIPSQSGDVFVLKAAPKYELLATNSVNERTNASLAAADGELFLRTDKGLWCLAAGK